jgi:hypothetical protein
MDRYTKSVLTVIAGCLLVLIGDRLELVTEASAKTQKIVDGESLVVGQVVVSTVCLKGGLYAIAHKINSDEPSIGIVQMWGGQVTKKCER